MKKFFCNKCMKQEFSAITKYRVHCYNSNGVGYTKIFETVQEASIELQQSIHKFDTVTLQKEFEFVEGKIMEKEPQ